MKAYRFTKFSSQLQLQLVFKLHNINSLQFWSLQGAFNRYNIDLPIALKAELLLTTLFQFSPQLSVINNTNT